MELCWKRLMVAIIFFLMPSAEAQDLRLYYGENKVIKDSIILLDYKEPVSIRVVEGMGGGDVSRPFLPALLCADSIRLGVSLDCFQARSKKDIFWDDPRVEFVTWEGSRKAVVFSANLNYSGSGATLLWTLLVLNHDGLWKNLFPEVTTSNQSDHLFWHSEALSSRDLFSLADYIWGKGEDHYGAHRYQIRTYEFCASSGKYALADEFNTNKKFAPLDAPQPHVVIRPMLPEIEQRLHRRIGGACSRDSRGDDPRPAGVRQ